MAKIKSKLKKKSNNSQWEIVDDLPKAQTGKITLDEFRPKFASESTKVQKPIEIGRAHV